MLADTAPQYARNLEQRALTAERQLASLEAGLMDLRRYLLSNKFGALAAGGNPRVERQDMLNRLDAAAFLASDC